MRFAGDRSVSSPQQHFAGKPLIFLGSHLIFWGTGPAQGDVQSLSGVDHPSPRKNKPSPREISGLPGKNASFGGKYNCDSR